MGTHRGREPDRERDQRILKCVRAHPEGTTVSKIVTELGIKHSSTVCNAIRRLEKAHLVRRIMITPCRHVFRAPGAKGEDPHTPKTEDILKYVRSCPDGATIALIVENAHVSKDGARRMLTRLIKENKVRKISFSKVFQIYKVV